MSIRSQCLVISKRFGYCMVTPTNDLRLFWIMLGIYLQCLLVEMRQAPSSKGSNVPFNQEAVGLCTDLGLETGKVRFLARLTDFPVI